MPVVVLVPIENDVLDVVFVVLLFEEVPVEFAERAADINRSRKFVA